MGYAEDSTILVLMPDNPEALRGFIEGHVEPFLQDLRTPEKVPSHAALLKRALRQRRIELREVGENRVFVFGGTVIGGMDSRVTTLVSAHGRRVAGDEGLTRKHLALQNVAMPPEESEEGPAGPSAAPGEPAAGQPAGGETAEEEPLQQYAREPVPGLDLRAFVVGGRVAGAVAYVPLSALEQRLDAPRLEALRRRPGNPEGGIAVEVTGQLDAGLAELAVDALWSVPGLAAGAVDLLVTGVDSAAGALVLGLDVEASVVPHHLPALGEPQDVAGAIVDQLLIRASR